MKAEAKSLRFLGEVKKLTVPFFQRKYVWDEYNWEELLCNFLDTDDMPFLGSVILKENSSKEEIIIDGQQRLTTITILAKAIYDCLSSESKQPGSGIRNCVENFLFYRINAADSFLDSHIRISHSHIDKFDYDSVLSSQMLSPSIVDINLIGEHSSNILRCYKYYCERLNCLEDDKLKQLFNSMFDEERKAFVLITLEPNDINEQTIFDTINRAGIRLSTADIIKNNLFKQLLDAAGSDETRKKKVIETYSNAWDCIFNIDKPTSDLWDEKRTFGNVQHSNLEFLLYCIACIKWPPIDGDDSNRKDFFSKLSDVYERETSKLSFHELILLTEEIKDYALIFKKYILDFKAKIDDEQNNEHFKYCDSVRRLLLILQKFGVQMFYPYILKRIKEVNQDDNNEQLIFDFSVIESFVVRRRISTKGTNDYTSKCFEIVSHGIQSLIKSDFDNPASGITDFDVKNYLLKTKDLDARVILFWIELYRRRLPSFDIQDLEFKYTLEHILPQKWANNWSNVPIIVNGDTYEPDTDEGKHMRNDYVQALGNKTLLTGSLNSSVRNESFEKKINGISANKPGYLSHTSLLLTKEIVDNYGVDPVWDEKHIFERTEKLFKEFVEIWPMFESESVEDNSENNIDNFTPEQLADPIMLLDAVTTEIAPDISEYIEQHDISNYLSVQSSTINKYFNEGKIVPDYIFGGNNYYTYESLNEYAIKFGWTLIDQENIISVFWNYINKMMMSYSYKPVLLKAIFSLLDVSTGSVYMNDVVIYFLDYYKSRLNSGLCAEKADSVFSKYNCSYDEAEKVIIRYPLKMFSDMSLLSYEPLTGIIKINSKVLDKISDTDIKKIFSICDQKLSSYFERL